jgi:DtxR family Mn-dependent transcriptional regulator
MEHNEHMENLLEAVMMAQEVGDTTVAGILGARAEDVQISLTEQDIEAAQGEGLVVRDGQEVRLTEAGAEIARRVVRRHRLSEMLLFTLLGVDRELASEIACRVEHGLREEMLEGVCTLLGHPSACPHGRPIPPGECCVAGSRVVESQVVPITELKPGEKGRIVYIQPRSHQRLHRLTSIGLMPGVVVELHRRSPAFCLRFEETDLALDPDVASDIHVSRLPR